MINFSLVIQYLDFFIINLDTIDEDALHKKQIEFIEYYLYFKFLKILKKKLNKIAYAFNTFLSKLYIERYLDIDFINYVFRGSLSKD